MSAVQVVAVWKARGFDLDSLKSGFWKWWIGLYAAAPRKLPPMI